MSVAVRLADDSIADDFPVILVAGLVAISPFMLFALLPAILIAQDRNGVYTALCPKAIASSIPGVYVVIWGFPLALVAIFILLDVHVRRVRENETLQEVNGRFFFTMVAIYTLWLSTTQLSIHFKGTFRTSIGKLLCWPGTIAAFALVVLSSLASIFMIVEDIMRIYSYIRER